MMKTWMAIVGTLLLFSSCRTECEYTEAELIVNEAVSKTNILSIRGPLCDGGSSLVVEDSNYYILSVVHEGAMSQERDPFESFELGRQITSPLTGINTGSRHIIEVRDRATLWNNINNPYLSETKRTNEGDVAQFKGEISLTGHPLYAILSLLNIDDKGGSKTWKIFRMENADGSSLSDLSHWQCYLDNRYTFLKGSRFKYDPNDLGDEGLICDRERALFPNPSMADNAFGSYWVDHEGGELQVKCTIRTSLSDSYEMIFKVRSYDWEELQVILRNDVGEQAVAILTPYEYNDTL